ncbi:MAG: GDSL-type esterase/lipase family protein [Verrucomicrobia bacterium]|nr:GDSL-type esterase/lipase family protein [Verrucomicrobiota bacterium]
MLGLVATLASLGLSGNLRAAPAAAEKPPVIKSANDPTKPVPGGVRWFWRMHGDYLNQTKTKKFDVCFLGDSITQMWPGDMFGTFFGKYNPVNFGIGGDRCENVLFRLNDGELQDATPKLIVLMIGTNNQGMNTAEEVVIGVTTVVKALRVKCPKSRILLLGILPSTGTPYDKTKAINTGIAKLADKQMIHYQDFGPKLLDKDGKILPGMLADAVHLTRQGYQVWGTEVSPTIEKLVK